MNVEGIPNGKSNKSTGPNVTLVDTNGKGIEAITEKGIIANGKEYELDCIIYATGFELATVSDG